MTEENVRIRVRFAPSPTGFLHVGSARTALFNWLFARSKDGDFILRVEDTDKKRSKKKYLDEILESMKWLGLSWDEKIHYQSKRGPIYKRYAKTLLKEEKAYIVRNGAVLFKMPKEKVVVNDLVHGEIEFDNTLQQDLVLMKKDGSPTYNFACVVDDIEMNITHIIRGDDHISNTPKQIPLYQALNAKVPQFVHIPLILGEDRSRLSKRHGATSISEYREAGYLPDALLNFLSLMGWSPGDNREIIPPDEIIRRFTVERIVKTSAVFNEDKLNWINSQYIKAMDTNRLATLLKPYLKKARLIRKDFSKDIYLKVVRLLKTRAKTLTEFVWMTEYFFTAQLKYDKEAVKKHLKKKGLKVILNMLAKELDKLRPFKTEPIERCCRDLIQRLGIRGGDLIHPVRVAITGRSFSPGLFEVMYLLGKKKTLKRLRGAIKKYCK